MSRLELPPNEGELKPFSFRLPAKLLDRVEAIATETGLSRSDIMIHFTRWACDEYDAEQEERKPRTDSDESYCSKCGQIKPDRALAEGRIPRRRASDRDPEAMDGREPTLRPAKERRLGDRKAK